MTTAGIMLGCIVLLGEIGLRVLWFGGGRRRSSRSGDGGAQAVMMIVAIVLMILAPIFAQMIYFALSRRREYLADASGAMFTRYPEGLASALEKLGGSTQPQADKSKVTAPMYIMEPRRVHGMAARGRGRSSFFSTHPPIEKRVKVLRSMAGGSGFRAYEKAFRRVVGSKAIGERTLAEAKDVPIEAPAAVEPTPRHDRVRQASDAFLAASGYQRRTCPGCGATLKLPPSLTHLNLRCPRCNATV
jgi:heat shock protein HtpX